jgi:hypothetical protein
VYRYCFVLDSPLNLLSRNSSRLQHVVIATNASAQLLRACKQLHDEGLAILYGDNLFKAPTLASVKSFSSCIGVQATACVQNLTIDDNSAFNNYQNSYKLFSRFSSLKTLDIITWKDFPSKASIPLPPTSDSMVLKRRSILLPNAIPNLPRDVADLFLAKEDLEVHFEVVMQFTEAKYMDIMIRVVVCFLPPRFSRLHLHVCRHIW